jgi:Ca-activated chloride channel homolog
MSFLNPLALFLLPFPFLLWLYLYAEGRANREWRKGRLAASVKFATLRPWLLGASALFLVLALSRPAWSPREISSSGRGQDSIFLVDVSRSMDTPDVDGGSRLSAVKRALLDLAPDFGSDRAALVAFAGTTVAKCPLTNDASFFRQAVELLDSSSAARGGTLLGDALRQVEKDFGQGKDKPVIWVFTDGGDQESFPAEAAAELGKAGFSLFVWGIGTKSGGTVPERGVSSALDEGLLGSVAKASGGAYYGSGDPLWQLGTEYRLKHRDTSSHGTSVVVWHEGAWWLLWPAFFCIVAEMSIGLSFSLKRRRKA